MQTPSPCPKRARKPSTGCHDLQSCSPARVFGVACCVCVVSSSQVPGAAWAPGSAGPEAAACICTVHAPRTPALRRPARAARPCPPMQPAAC